jgi:hypothetical protein
MDSQDRLNKIAEYVNRCMDKEAPSITAMEMAVELEKAYALRNISSMLTKIELAIDVISDSSFH